LRFLIYIGMATGYLKNLDFSQGFLHWKAFREGDVIFSIDEGEKALKAVFNGGVWAVEHKRLVPIKGREHYVLSAEAKCSFAFRDSTLNPNHASIAADMLDQDLKIVQVRFKEWPFGDPGEPFMLTNVGDWRCGEIGLSGNWKWRNVLSFFRVPEGAHFMRLSLRGRGSGELLVRNLCVEDKILEGTLARGHPRSKGIPGARMYNRMKLGNHAAKVLRIGDLDGDARPEYIFAQNEVVGSTSFEDYRQISCLTVIDEGGHIMWQKGEPDIDNFDVTSDLPIAALDINGDGKDEVICCSNFELQVLNGADGKPLRSVPTPNAKGGQGFMIGRETLFSRILGDCIAFCDLGSGRKWNIILKDRYNNLWCYADDLQQLWSYSGKLAHSPLIWDFDDDGRDEVFAGDALIDADGKVLWDVELYDHCDSAIFYKWKDRSVLCIANQNGGFYFLDALTGELMREWHLGHAQVLSLGNFDPAKNSQLICAQTYWGGINQFLFDLGGGLVFAGFEEVYGWVPVNWVGDGSELLAAPQGLYDCYGNLVVEFPDRISKGRSGSKVYAWNVCGDPRDEVLVWDDSYLTIYTQVDRMEGRIYSPYRRLYNQTFYGNIISKPGWSEP
jgi:hypothetical protein